MFEKRAICVMGVVVPIDASDFAIDDIDQAQRTSPQLVAFWASVKGSAKAEADAADAKYRQWRGQATMKVFSDPADKDSGKLPEWKVKAVIDAHPDFIKLKNALAQAADNLTTAEGLFEAARLRANLAQSVGANVRETLRKLGTGVTRVPNGEDSDDVESVPNDTESEATRRGRLKDILGSRKKPGAATVTDKEKGTNG